MSKRTSRKLSTALAADPFSTSSSPSVPMSSAELPVNNTTSTVSPAYQSVSLPVPPLNVDTPTRPVAGPIILDDEDMSEEADRDTTIDDQLPGVSDALRSMVSSKANKRTPFCAGINAGTSMLTKRPRLTNAPQPGLATPAQRGPAIPSMFSEATTPSQPPKKFPGSARANIRHTAAHYEQLRLRGDYAASLLTASADSEAAMPLAKKNLASLSISLQSRVRNYTFLLDSGAGGIANLPELERDAIGDEIRGYVGEESEKFSELLDASLEQREGEPQPTMVAGSMEKLLAELEKWERIEDQKVRMRKKAMAESLRGKIEEILKEMS